MNQGLHCFLQGYLLINRAGLRRYVVMPLLVNLALFIGLWFVFLNGLHWISAKLDAFLPNWLHWLDWLLWPLFLLTFALILFYGFSIFANLIASPFNAQLSERVQHFLTQQSPLPSASYAQIMKDLLKNIKRQFEYLLYFLPRAFLLSLLFFVPGVHILAPAAWFIFMAWMSSVQYLDYPMDNNKVSFRDLKKQLKQKSGVSYGFGLAAGLATLIPGINFFVMPVAVAGATLLWVNEFNSPTKHEF